jgi:hypothetical protein
MAEVAGLSVSPSWDLEPPKCVEKIITGKCCTTGYVRSTPYLGEIAAESGVVSRRFWLLSHFRQTGISGKQMCV